MKNSYNDYFKKVKIEKDNKKMNSKSKKMEKNKVRFSSKNPIEEQLQHLLKVKSKSRKKNSSHWGLVSFLLIGTLAAGWGFYDLDSLLKTWNQLEVSYFTLAEAESTKGEEKSDKTKDVSAESSTETKETKESEEKLSIKNWTDEELSHLSKLNERKVELDKREKELAKLEEELHKQKLEIEGRIKKLEELRSKISGVLKEKVEVDTQKVDKLVAFYSSMKPSSAAKIIENLNEDLAVEVLSKMKKKSAAEIMNLLKSDKAQALSEKFAGYKY
ncbi:MAG: hypothetical protein KDD40_05275 [Bdellovibrionales bacterium]|nr:hypothetical protein [Bdellovibrionales bacterium]